MLGAITNIWWATDYLYIESLQSMFCFYVFLSMQIKENFMGSYPMCASLDNEDGKINLSFVSDKKVIEGCGG